MGERRPRVQLHRLRRCRLEDVRSWSRYIAHYSSGAMCRAAVAGGVDTAEGI